MEKVHFT